MFILLRAKEEMTCFSSSILVWKIPENTLAAVNFSELPHPFNVPGGINKTFKI